METSVEDDRQADRAVEIQTDGIAAVTMGEVSVSPQPCATVLPVTSFQRAATTGCTAMPPARSTRRALKSTDANPGVCSKALNSVLTPLMKLNLYFLSSATNAGKSRGFVISTLRAPSGRKARQLLVSAKMWYSGSAVITMRPPPAWSAGLIHASACSRFATMLRWVSMAALATPVVPPVYCRKAMSSGPKLNRFDLESKPASQDGS